VGPFSELLAQLSKARVLAHFEEDMMRERGQLRDLQAQCHQLHVSKTLKEEDMWKKRAHLQSLQTEYKRMVREVTTKEVPAKPRPTRPRSASASVCSPGGGRRSARRSVSSSGCRVRPDVNQFVREHLATECAASPTRLIFSDPRQCELPERRWVQKDASSTSLGSRAEGHRPQSARRRCSSCGAPAQQCTPSRPAKAAPSSPFLLPESPASASTVATATPARWPQMLPSPSSGGGGASSTTTTARWQREGIWY